MSDMCHKTPFSDTNMSNALVIYETHIKDTFIIL